MQTNNSKHQQIINLFLLSRSIILYYYLLFSDVAAYILQGRVDPISSWITIGEGGLDAMPGRNSRGLGIASTFESPDPALAWVTVDFSSNTAAFLEYRLTITDWVDPNKMMFQFAEIELPGYLL